MNLPKVMTQLEKCHLTSKWRSCHQQALKAYKFGSLKKKITGKNQLTAIYFDMLWLHCKKSQTSNNPFGKANHFDPASLGCVCWLCPWLMSMEDMKVEVLHTPEVELWTLASLLCWSSISHLRRFRHMILGTWQSQLFTKPRHNRDTQLAESDAGISIQSQGILEVFLWLSWSIYSCRRSGDFIISYAWNAVRNISAQLLRWLETQLTSRMVTLLGVGYT